MMVGFSGGFRACHRRFLERFSPSPVRRAEFDAGSTRGSREASLSFTSVSVGGGFTLKTEVDPLLARMISDLGQLERIFRNTLKLPKVRKRKHEIDDVLILKLADTLSADNALILIQEFGCAVVKIQGHLGNSVSE